METLNPMELLYFNDYGRLEIEHECEMCEQFPLESLNEPCLNCGVTQSDLIELKTHVANTNEAIDYYNSKIKKNDDGKPVAISAELVLSHVSIGGNDCNKIVLSDYEGSPYLVPIFAPFVNFACDVIVYPKIIDEIDFEELW